MRKNLTATLLLAATLFCGCSRSRITTEIKAGDSWTRTVALSGQQKKDGGMNIGALEDAFVLPAGSEWKSREEKKGDERTVTFERTLAAGASLKGDLSLKGGDPGQLVLVNEVTVTRVAPRRYEYRETLRWTGPPPPAITPKPEEIAEVKANLPKALATDANARAVIEKAGRLAIPVLFGPGDPLLAIGLLHPDLATRRLSQRLATVLMTALQEQFGDKMQAAERREVTRKLLEVISTQNKPSQPDPAAGPPKSSDNSGLTPLMFIVKSGGKVISTNGETDDLTGEIYWALFPEAAFLQPVILTAVVQVDQ